jgi:hypothetical protein
MFADVVKKAVPDAGCTKHGELETFAVPIKQ